MPQAGVAIGPAILSGRQFNAEPGKLIIMLAMSATFIMEIIGPIFAREGVKRAGEIGMNVSEEDLIKTYKVRDVMDEKPTAIRQETPLQQILETFSTTDSAYYPVVDNNSKIIGKITIAGIKEMFANQDVAGWLLACDAAEPIPDKTTPQRPLEEALEYMRKYDLEHLVVVASPTTDKLAGILDFRQANRKISAEVLRRRETADGLILAAG